MKNVLKYLYNVRQSKQGHGCAKMTYQMTKGAIIVPIYESGEDYLETILLLHGKTGFVRSVDIANELNYSKPSISRAMNILRENGLITVAPGGQILLTEEGQRKAESVYDRHVVITAFFETVLGVDKDTAEHDACKIEHIISEESYQKLKQFTAAYDTAHPRERN